MILNMGGNDITEFLYVLLSRINFPYKEVDLSRSYDWSLMEDLKARLCTLTEVWICLDEAFWVWPCIPGKSCFESLRLYSSASRKTYRKVWVTCIWWDYSRTYGGFYAAWQVVHCVDLYHTILIVTVWAACHWVRPEAHWTSFRLTSRYYWWNSRTD